MQPALVAHGLLQHETKLSVLNFAVKKDANFSETLQNKTELLFVTGLRYSLLLLLTIWLQMFTHQTGWLDTCVPIYKPDDLFVAAS